MNPFTATASLFSAAKLILFSESREIARNGLLALTSKRLVQNVIVIDVTKDGPKVGLWTDRVFERAPALFRTERDLNLFLRDLAAQADLFGDDWSPPSILVQTEDAPDREWTKAALLTIRSDAKDLAKDGKTQPLALLGSVAVKYAIGEIVSSAVMRILALSAASAATAAAAPEVAALLTAGGATGTASLAIPATLASTTGSAVATSSALAPAVVAAATALLMTTTTAQAASVPLRAAPLDKDDREVQVPWTPRFMTYTSVVPNLKRLSGAWEPNRKIGGVLRPHYARDLAVPLHSAVFAPADGTVSKMTVVGPLNKSVYLSVEKTLSTPACVVVLRHMATFAPTVKVGAIIKRDELLGTSGTAGTGPHVHLEVGAPSTSADTDLPPLQFPTRWKSKNSGLTLVDPDYLFS